MMTSLYYGYLEHHSPWKTIFHVKNIAGQLFVQGILLIGSFFHQTLLHRTTKEVLACHDGAEVSASGLKIGRSPVQISPKTNFSNHDQVTS